LIKVLVLFYLASDDTRNATNEFRIGCMQLIGGRIMPKFYTFEIGYDLKVFMHLNEEKIETGKHIQLNTKWSSTKNLFHSARSFLFQTR
jgi:hypothetical protein